MSAHNICFCGNISMVREGYCNTEIGEYCLTELMLPAYVCKAVPCLSHLL